MERLKIKRIISGAGILTILAILVIPSLFAIKVSAQTKYEYTVLAPLPGTTNVENCTGTDCKTTLEKYLPGVFKLAIGLSAVFAVLMIVIGGFQYISTDAIQKKTDGKERIKNALYGLVLVISAWLILNTINPKLLELRLDIEPITVAAPAKGTLGGELSAGTGKVLPGYDLTPAQIAINNAMRKELEDKYGVKVNAGPCASSGTTGCTNLVGMTDITFRGVVDLKKTCGDSCNVTITGGTEGGHKSHGPNQPPIDLRFDPNLDSYILKNQVSAPQTIPGVGTLYTSKVGNRNATFLKEDNHWHVVFE